METTLRADDASTARFWTRVDKTDTCWNWSGNTNNKGYGRFVVKGKRILAHRYSWVLHRPGMFPEGKVVYHICKNTLCVNPAHLRLGNYNDRQ